MNNTILIVLLTLSIVTSAKSQSILGKWLAKDMKNSTIQIDQDDTGKLLGVIASSDNVDWVGMIILTEVKHIEKEEVWTGKLYSPLRKTDVNVTMEPTSEHTLKVVGKKYLFKRTFYWNKQ